MDDLFSVKDKVVVITGGLGYLGVSWRGALVRQGARVAVLDVRKDDFYMDYLKAKMHLKFRYYPCDVSSDESVDRAYNEIENELGVPDGLVNAAAIDFPPGAKDQNVSRVFDVNLTGTIRCCFRIGREMAKKGRGSIINIGSIYGINGPDQSLYSDGFEKPIAYSASKAGLIGVTKYLAAYWGKQNVRVNLLTLGGVYNNQAEDFCNKYKSKVPLNRMAKNDEYDGAIQFLLSDASSYMTGANVVIDGGYSSW